MTAAGDLPAGKAALARALAQLERAPDTPETLDLLDRAHAAARGHVVGITGPPGVGKSTLIGALIRAWRAGGRTVAVAAVDPSSRRTGGALLGDRTRIKSDPGDEGVFIRSMAARDRLGGLSSLTYGAVALMRALYDIVVVETVGVGQSETDIATVADTVLLCLQPGSGDSLQYMKAGIAEIPDIVVVTKAETASAARTAADAKSALGLTGDDRHDGWQVPVLLVSAAEGIRLDALRDAVDDHAAHLAIGGRRAAHRHVQAKDWLAGAIVERFGRDGLARAGIPELAPDEAPFPALKRVIDRFGRSTSK